MCFRGFPFKSRTAPLLCVQPPGPRPFMQNGRDVGGSQRPPPSLLFPFKGVFKAAATVAAAAAADNLCNTQNKPPPSATTPPDRPADSQRRGSAVDTTRRGELGVRPCVRGAAGGCGGGEGGRGVGLGRPIMVVRYALSVGGDRRNNTASQVAAAERSRRRWRWRRRRGRLQ